MQDSRYTIQEAELSIYDISGRLVRSFNHESCIMNHGSAISWDGTDQADRQLGSGVYFVTLRTGNYSETRKALLVR
jgi:flagellar hook assembly protein FlgD